MKRFYTFIIVVLAFAANAQNHNNWVRHSQSDGINYGNFSSEAEFLINAADELYSQREYQKAISCYLASDSISPLNDSALIGLVHCYYNLLDYPNCVATGERWIAAYGDSSSLENRRLCYGMLSNSYHFTEDYNNAIIYYNKFLRISDKDRRAMAWEKFMLGKSYYEVGNMIEMKRNCTDATMDLCMFFGITFTDIWNGEVKNEELGVLFYYFSVMLREGVGDKVNADAAMMLSVHCGLEEAAEYCKTHRVSKSPYKSKVLAKDRNKKHTGK